MDLTIVLVLLINVFIGGWREFLKALNSKMENPTFYHPQRRHTAFSLEIETLDLNLM